MEDRHEARPYSLSRRGGLCADLVAQRLDVLFVSYPAVEPVDHAGSVRVLAVASENRSNLVPNAPTAAEEGVKGFVLSTWNGLMGPRGLPASIVTKLNAAVNAILTDPAVIARLAAMGMAPIPGTPEAFARRIEDELVEMAKLVKVANITAN